MPVLQTPFFDNKGAVAGTFVAVGLVIVGVVLALGLLCFRRRRRQRLDREVTAAAVAASSAAHRSPLDEGEDLPSASASGGGHQTSESYPSTVSGPMQQYGNYGASYAPAGGYDPYAQQPVQQHYQDHAQQPYQDHPGQGPFDTPGGYHDGYNGGYGDAGGGYGGDAAVFGGGAAAAAAGGVAGYHGMSHDQNQQGYYFDPRDAENYTDEHGYDQGQQLHHPHAQGGGQYDDPYAGYSGGEGSVDTPTNERDNPLHVSVERERGTLLAGY